MKPIRKQLLTLLAVLTMVLAVLTPAALADGNACHDGEDCAAMDFENLFLGQDYDAEPDPYPYAEIAAHLRVNAFCADEARIAL